MKTTFRTLTAAAALCLATVAAQAADGAPSYLDFSDIAPGAAGESVEVDLDEGLLTLASRFADGHEKEAAEVLRGLKSVQVRVISLDDKNREAVVSRIGHARTHLARDGWKRVAVVKQGNGQDVAVFARTKGAEAIQGIAVTVLEGTKQAVIVNVIGEIRPEQITALGARFGIEELKDLQIASK